MEAGRYNELISIYQPTTVRNSVGSTTVTWTLKCGCRANVKYNSGSRNIVAGSEVFYDMSKTFIVRSYVDIDEEDRILFQSKYYRVISINHRRDYNDIEIIAELVNE